MSSKKEKKSEEKETKLNQTLRELERLQIRIDEIYNSVEEFSDLSEDTQLEYVESWKQFKKTLQGLPHGSKTIMVSNPQAFNMFGKKGNGRSSKQKANNVKPDAIIARNEDLIEKIRERQKEAREREIKAPLEQETKQLKEEKKQLEEEIDTWVEEAKSLNEENKDLNEENKQQVSKALIEIRNGRNVDIKKQPKNNRLPLLIGALKATVSLYPAIKTYEDYMLLIADVISNWTKFKDLFTQKQDTLKRWFTDAKQIVEKGLGINTLYNLYQSLDSDILGQLKDFTKNLSQDNPIIQKVTRETKKIIDRTIKVRDELLDTPINIKNANLLSMFDDYKLSNNERFALDYMTTRFRDNQFVKRITSSNLLSQANRDYVKKVANKLKQGTITPQEIYNLAREIPESLVKSLKPSESKESKERPIPKGMETAASLPLPPSEPLQRPSIYAPIDITSDDIKTMTRQKGSLLKEKKSSKGKTKKRTEKEQSKKDIRQQRERIRRREEQKAAIQRRAEQQAPKQRIPTPEEVFENVDRMERVDEKGEVVFTEGPLPGVAPRVATIADGDSFKKVPLDFSTIPPQRKPRKPTPTPKASDSFRETPKDVPPLPKRPPPLPPRSRLPGPERIPYKKDEFPTINKLRLKHRERAKTGSEPGDQPRYGPPPQPPPDEAPPIVKVDDIRLPAEMQQEREITRTETKSQIPLGDDPEVPTREILVNEVGRINFRTRQFETRDLQDTLLMRKPDSLKAQLDPRVIQEKQERLTKEHMVPERETVEDVHVPGQLVDDDIDDDVYPDSENPLMQSNIEWQKDIYSGAYEESIDGVLRTEIYNLQGKDYEAIDSDLPEIKHAKTTESVTWDPMNLYPYDDMSKMAPADVLDSVESYLQQDSYTFNDEPYDEAGFPRISQIQVYQPWKDVSEHTRTDVDDMPMSEIIPRRGYARWAEHDAMNLNNDIYTRSINAF